MTVVLLLILLAGPVLAACGAPYRRVWAALPPRSTATLVAASLIAAVIFSYVGLALLAAPAAFQVLPAVQLSAACQRLLARIDPGGPFAAWLATALLMVSACAVIACSRRLRRERRGLRIEPDVGIRERVSEFDVVVLPTHVPLAYSVGGPPPQVVISQGLRDRLDKRAFAAVVEHEAAHLHARHDRWLRLAALMEVALWFLPWVRRATATLRLSLELWADEEAARAVGRGAVLDGLLAAIDAAPMPAPAAALSGAEALAERLAKLADGPPPRRGALAGAGRGWLAMMGLAGISAGAGLVAALSVVAHLCTA
jgi:beta-lactamase regulating signal transducer with metallopeptidase domain